MISDFVLKWDIIHYAKSKGIYYEGFFEDLFSKSKKMRFKREEVINRGKGWEDHLCFIHSGAVLGTLINSKRAKEVHLLLEQQIFFCGKLGDIPISLLEVEWMAVKPTEITSISMDVLLKALEEKDPKGLVLRRHIAEEQRAAKAMFDKLREFRKIEDKISFVMEENPQYRKIMKKYMAEWMGVSPYSLSRALADWSEKYLV